MKIFTKGKEIGDKQMLNELIGDGRGAWVDVVQHSWEATKKALVKRGKWKKPTHEQPIITTVPQEGRRAVMLQQEKAMLLEGKTQNARSKITTAATRHLYTNGWKFREGDFRGDMPVEIKDAQYEPSDSLIENRVPDDKAQQLERDHSIQNLIRDDSSRSAEKESAQDFRDKSIKEQDDTAEEYSDGDDMEHTHDNNAKSAKNAHAGALEKQRADSYNKEIQRKTEMNAKRTKEDEVRKAQETAKHIAADTDAQADNLENGPAVKKEKESPMLPSFIVSDAMWVQDDDGEWSKVREQVGDMQHPIDRKDLYKELDEGIPVLDRLEEEEKEKEFAEQEKEEDDGSLLEKKQPQNLVRDAQLEENYLDQVEAKPKKMSADKLAELKALKTAQDFEEAQAKKAQEEQHASMMKTSTEAPVQVLGPMDADLAPSDATPRDPPAITTHSRDMSVDLSFIQVKSSSSPKSASLVDEEEAKSASGYTKRERRALLDGYLQKQAHSEFNNDAVRHKEMAGKLGFALTADSAEVLKLKAARDEQVAKSRQWIAEADPDYAGPGPDLMPVTSDEIKRVDIMDHNMYTKRQYRMKHKELKRDEADRQFKKMPTERRVKNLGKKAFVQRFR